MKCFLFPISPSKNNRCPFNAIRYNANFSELKGLRSLPFISYGFLPIRHAITAPIPSYMSPNGRRKYRVMLYHLFVNPNIRNKDRYQTEPHKPLISTAGRSYLKKSIFLLWSPNNQMKIIFIFYICFLFCVNYTITIITVCQAK